MTMVNMLTEQGSTDLFKIMASEIGIKIGEQKDMEFTFLHKHIKDASTCETVLMGKQWKVAELLYSKAIGKIPHNGIG